MSANEKIPWDEGEPDVDREYPFDILIPPKVPESSP
jgi:hypothetical protein